MNPTLLKALVALLPASMLVLGSLVSFRRSRSAYSMLQTLGAACLVLVIITHLCEGLRLFPAMGWGLEHTPGHYLDLGSALLALALFPVGFLLHALDRPQ